MDSSDVAVASTSAVRGKSSGRRSATALVLRLVRAAVIGYLCVILLMLFIENRLIFIPSRAPRESWSPPTPAGEDVVFQAEDGTQLVGWYLPHPQPRAVVLFMNGNGGNVSYWRDAFELLHERAHATILGFDYRGYGRSDGSPSERGVLADARAARKLLAEKAGVREDQIVLMGRSLGGGVACDLAQDGARALVIESSFTSLPDVAARLYTFLPVRWVMKSRFDSLRKIAACRSPLFVSHGDADRLTPYSMGQALYDSAGSTIKRFYTIRGGNHNDPQPVDYYDALGGFFAELP